MGSRPKGSCAEAGVGWDARRMSARGSSSGDPPLRSACRRDLAELARIVAVTPRSEPSKEALAGRQRQNAKRGDMAVAAPRCGGLIARWAMREPSR